MGVDDVDVVSARYFVNSSFALVLLLRRRIKSVADVSGVFVRMLRAGQVGCITK